MDGLIAHILQELAFEGDLGSDVSRLRQIISQYHATQFIAASHPQIVDDKFCAFVWTVLAIQDHVVVGVVPEGAATVYFPPQPSKIKADGKGKTKKDTVSISLTPLPSNEVSNQSLDSLMAKYGDALRVAVEPDICFVCLTGSHIRPSKLSANAYAVLQLITRARTEGISVTDISRQSGYDPKTCFYFVKILVDLGHIHKIKVGGTAVNICVHKSFYKQCAWRVPARKMTQEAEIECAAEEDNEEDDEVDGANQEFTANIQFEPIDNRHMSNIAVVKARIKRLLRHMPNGLHVYRHLLEAIGFKSTLKKERRVFTHRVHELLKARFIEKVWAQSNSSSTGRVLCIRLVNDVSMVDDDTRNSDQQPNVEAMELVLDRAQNQNDQATNGSLGEFEGVHVTQSIAAQIISLIEQSSVNGMTLADISKCLHNFDPRSITKLAATFSSGQPPTHLSHRALVIVTEMYGRERRQRLFTLAAYRQMIQQEGLEDQSVLSLEGARHWAPFDPGDFVEDEAGRSEWLEIFVRRALGRGGKTREKRAKQGFAVNPLDENGLPTKGRPRTKRAEVKIARRAAQTKRKAQDLEAGVLSSEPAAKKRRAPSKPQAANGSQAVHENSHVPTASSATVSKPRARPEQSQPVANTSTIPSETLESVHDMVPEDRPIVSTEHEDTPNLSNGFIQSKQTGFHSAYNAAQHPPRSTNPDSTLSISSSDSSRPVGQYSRPERTQDGSINLVKAQYSVRSVVAAEPAVPALLSKSSPGDLVLPDENSSTAPSTLADRTSQPIVVSAHQPDQVAVANLPAQSTPRPNKTTNVSALRRQTEFIQLLETKGGVINVSLLKAFNDEHQKLLQTLYVAGKTVSTTPGTGMDKRTFNATISALEARGLVKTLVVSALTIHGTTRRANLVYLINTSQESIDKCVEEFRAAGFGKSVPLPSDFPQVEGVSYGDNNTAYKAAPSPPLAPAPLPPDPLSAAREAQLADVQTAAQVVGYKTGHFARARALYLLLLSEIFSATPPASLVSPGERIFSRRYMCDDMLLSTYCTVIPQHTVIPGLKEMLETELGGNTRVHDVPENIRSHLRYRSSANHSRIHKLLSSLVGLGCLVPATVRFDDSTSTTNYVDIPDAEGNWEYIRLTQAVPVYRFADKESGVPFSYSHEIRNYDDGVKLWEQLQAASQTATCRSFHVPVSGTQFSGNPKLLRGIRRKGAWTDTYVLSAPQVDYLYSLVDPATGKTPLDDGSSTRFDHACFVTTAPVTTVSEFFSRTRADIQRGLERIQALAEQKAKNLRKITEEARHTLAIKAAQAKKDQDSRWESIASSVLEHRDALNPQFQKALALLKAEFLFSSQQVNNSSWEDRIKQAYQDALGAKQFVIVSPVPPEQVPATRKSQEELDPSVSRLIVQQGAPIQQKKDVAPKKSGRKSRKELSEAAAVKKDIQLPLGSEVRRRRFPWNPDYDELARDAAAILRVRCRTKRMDWSAIEQVFPGVQRNSVRQRVSNLQTLPGASEYFRSLDDAWATLWLEHRGSEALPDPNPDSVSDFDLPAHVSFLRRNIDKAALHAGANLAKPEVPVSQSIVKSVEQILAEYDVKENDSVPQPTSWNFYFDIPSEERREREFLQHPFVIYNDDAPMQGVPLNIAIAQGAVKMVISTPEALYNADDAAATLALIGDHAVKSAMQNMEENIVKKQAKAGKSYPLRQYTYSDSALYHIKGEFADAMHADASIMRDHLAGLGDEEWRNVDLTDEDGETAVYLELLSDNKLNISIDTTIPAEGRYQLGWQSKKVAEAAISDMDQLGMLSALCHAGADGIPIRQLLHGLYDGDTLAASTALATLATTSPPLVYAGGYDQARVVHASALRDWTMTAIQSPAADNETEYKVVFPRLWITIHGDLLEDTWMSVTRAVAGSLMFRPGISEYALRKRYHGVFDRQELNDILKYLLFTKKLQRITNFNLPVGMLDSEMEKTTYWVLADGNAWF
ncbi:B-block-binding subunit of tfiiic protein [Ceratobasidium sp. AG-Ba]|nr:B-block-binding subunit of tfiiic protein [Ceratobasidium sp. AG-Ba]